MGPSEAELCYAIRRGTLSDPSIIPHWDDLTDMDRETIVRCNEIALRRGLPSEKPIGELSDGYHTFNELYDHRHALFCALMFEMWRQGWKSKLHEDGSKLDGWFIAGFQTPKGPISYHLPMSWWDRCIVLELDRAPHWDGHSSSDVIERLLSLLTS